MNISERDIHIWHASLEEGGGDVDYFFSMLSKEERERVFSFKFLKDQRRFTIFRGVLKEILSQYLNKPPQGIKIGYGPWGKPRLINEEKIYFNVSHSKEHALYAISRNYEVGVDLEKIDDEIDLEGVVLSLFSESERAYWQNMSPAKKRDFFFSSWVSREAFLKTYGKGFLEDSPSFIFKEDEENSLGIKMKKPHCFQCVPGYASAFFIDGPFLYPVHYDWTF